VPPFFLPIDNADRLPRATLLCCPRHHPRNRTGAARTPTKTDCLQAPMGQSRWQSDHHTFRTKPPNRAQTGSLKRGPCVSSIWKTQDKSGQRPKKHQLRNAPIQPGERKAAGRNISKNTARHPTTVAGVRSNRAQCLARLPASCRQRCTRHRRDEFHRLPRRQGQTAGKDHRRQHHQS